MLPSLMLYWPRSPPKPETQRTSHWNLLGRFLVRHRVIVATSCFALSVAAGGGFWKFRTETKVIRYFPQDSRLVQDYAFLEDKLSGVISIDTIVKFDTKAQSERSFVERARLVMDLQTEIRGHSEISGVLSLASFLDLRVPDPDTMNRFQREKLRRSQMRIGREIHERLRSGED
ncbi:MAG: hypothetical protein GY826_19925, partial [Fuerstiella sp.]|nr:hypothetical protein [Fuerstiella sp.]